MKVAVIGSGISGNTLAYLLNKNHNVSLYEKDKRIGGHSHTHEIVINNKKVNVDTGFIVFNKKTYPLFTSLLNNLGVKYENSNMSFSVFSKENNFEYNGTSLNSLFSQRRNLLSPKFLKMIFEILRFNKESIKLKSKTILLKQYLKNNNYSTYFCKNYILPMGAAIWSTSIKEMENVGVEFFVKFFFNHGLLDVTNRPQWYVVPGGSRPYIKPLIRGFADKINLNTNIKSVTRQNDEVTIEFANGEQSKFDKVIFACHSDQALALLGDATEQEKSVLGAIAYTENSVVLHTDTNLLPDRKAAWASWNYLLNNNTDKAAVVTYQMNILQGI